ncbi:hypothetical protein JRI60_02630 [Archangium violaceum]|uniref:hypothetical protein n=1 Tax=Archangium violaceum TaxID=83451 RepID=UPI0019509245|nr:hypothetical protein [Archangium violaceum]QRN97988.1 hypothetical protein JRI60_02630 [Archangium violaceum]
MPNNPNDQRSNVKNPNNDSFKKDQDNRSNQQNPNNDAHPSRQADSGGSSSSGSVPGSPPSQTKR